MFLYALATYLGMNELSRTGTWLSGDQGRAGAWGPGEVHCHGCLATVDKVMVAGGYSCPWSAGGRPRHPGPAHAVTVPSGFAHISGFGRNLHWNSSSKPCSTAGFSTAVSCICTDLTVNSYSLKLPLSCDVNSAWPGRVNSEVCCPHWGA